MCPPLLNEPLLLWLPLLNEPELRLGALLRPIELLRLIELRFVEKEWLEDLELRSISKRFA
jgi:hypothetical protein